MTKMIDPPSGWIWGFPKELPEDIEDNKIIDWIIDNGYPRREMEACGDYFFYRIYYKEDMEETVKSVFNADTNR